MAIQDLEFEEETFQYAVDIPNADSDEWICVEYFDTKEEAIKFAMEKFGADENGNINLVSKID